MLLALDTATRQTGLALFDGRQVIAEINWRSANGQTTELLPRLDQLMSWHGVTTSDLAGLAVSLGPGSFTGLRVALSVAKGMALAHDLPLVGIPTLDATAYPYLGQGHPVCAVVLAGRGRVCWAIYCPDNSYSGRSSRSTPDPGAPVPRIGEGECRSGPDRAGGGLGQEPAPSNPELLRRYLSSMKNCPEPATIGSWQGWRTPYRLTDVEKLVASIDEPTTFVGELSDTIRQALQAVAVGRAVLVPPSVALRRAGVLAELGWTRLQTGQRDDPATLSPIYLHQP